MEDFDFDPVPFAPAEVDLDPIDIDGDGQAMAYDEKDDEEDEGDDMDDVPIFELNKVPWAPSRNAGIIKSLTVASDMVVIATKNLHVIRLHLNSARVKEEGMRRVVSRVVLIGRSSC
jgi:hypothetical protein